MNDLKAARKPGAAGLFEIQSMSCWYTPEKPVFAEVNFVVPDGAAVGILGGNGAGKTTFFNGLTKIIAGTAYRGAWFAHGQVSLDAPEFKRNRILVSSQDRSFGTWRFAEYLAFLQDSYQRTVDQSRQENLVHEFGFAEYARRGFAELSIY